MTATQTLAAWLLEQIAADEARFRGVAGDEQHQQWAFEQSADLNDGWMVDVALQMLAVCEAHRRIVEACQYAASPEFESDYDLAPRYDLADDTLRALAAIYADRDGFRESWR